MGTMGSKREKKPNTESVDDYLKVIFHLGRDGMEQVSGGAIAERLGVANASVTNMVQKLALGDSPLVNYERHGGACLTEYGRKRALEIIRHHRLIETFLFQELGYPVEELHDEAERLEHFISETIEQRLAEKLGNPTTDPHGHCIPALDGSMPRLHGLSCRCE
jgi:DtxR family Mn-dependent transcriptional regulator